MVLAAIHKRDRLRNWRLLVRYGSADLVDAFGKVVEVVLPPDLGVETPEVPEPVAFGLQVNVVPPGLEPPAGVAQREEPDRAVLVDRRAGQVGRAVPEVGPRPMLLGLRLDPAVEEGVHGFALVTELSQVDHVVEAGEPARSPGRGRAREGWRPARNRGSRGKAQRP